MAKDGAQHEGLKLDDMGIDRLKIEHCRCHSPQIDVTA